MAKTYLLYERRTGRISKRYDSKFPVNESPEGFGWLEHTLRPGQEELNFRHWKVVDGTLEDISDTLPDETLTIDDVKRECHFRIVAAFPVWRQVNYARRAYWLNQKGSRTADETAELEKLNAVFAWIDAMRDKSNELEATPDAAFSGDSWPDAPAGP